MVTILMCTYNSASYISYAIRSILNQTYKDFEFVIIDDGSIDDTKTIISHINDNRLKYKNKEHTNLGDSLNYGLKIAQNDIIVRMDADDIAHPSRIEKQLKILTQESYKEIIASWYAVFKEEKIMYIVKTPRNNEEIIKSLALYSTIPHSGCMYNRNFILENGGYTADIFEDYSLWLRLKDKISFYNIPEVLTYIRYRHDSLSRNKFEVNQKLIYKIQEPYYEDLLLNFKTMKVCEINKVKGWREYFYGSKKLARQYWHAKEVNLFHNYRLLLAFIVSFLPDKLFLKFKEIRFRFRINYLYKYFHKENKILRKLLKVSLQQ